MSVKFNFDISMDELNLPQLENYSDAKFFANKVKIGNFIKKYWGRLKLNITEEERVLNSQMRNTVSPRSVGRKAVEVDYSKITERDYAYWFRPAECFANVIVPVYLLNGRSSTPADRYQIIVNEYHAAIYDTQDFILYDPTIDTLDLLGANYAAEEKKIAILGLLLTKEGISIHNRQLHIGTLSLSEFLNNFQCAKTDKPLRDFFNDALGREVIKADAVGKDLRKLI